MFILAVHADGELVDNTQVSLMMKLVLAVIWMSAFQKAIVSSPLFRWVVHLEENQPSKDDDNIHVIQTKVESFLLDFKKGHSFSGVFSRIVDLFHFSDYSSHPEENEDFV